MSALAVLPKPTTSLYALSEELIAYLDTLELTEPDSPERAEVEAAIERYMQQLPQKVDSTDWVLVHLYSQRDVAKQEKTRLAAREKSFDRQIERLEDYIVRVVESQPPDKKGKHKLEGSAVTFTLRPSEGAIVTNEALVPAEYKTAVVELQERAWHTLVALYPQIIGAFTHHQTKVRLSDVKAALKAGERVDGADIEYRNNLVRR